MKKILLFITCFILCKNIFCQDDLVKITWLNPADTIPSNTKDRKNIFILESTKEPLLIESIMSSCGCECPEFNYKKNGGRLFPGIPDTLIIHSSFVGKSGAWLKSTSIKTFDNNVQFIYTKFYILKEEEKLRNESGKRK